MGGSVRPALLQSPQSASARLSMLLPRITGKFRFKAHEFATCSALPSGGVPSNGADTATKKWNLRRHQGESTTTLVGCCEGVPDDVVRLVLSIGVISSLLEIIASKISQGCGYNFITVVAQLPPRASLCCPRTQHGNPSNVWKYPTAWMGGGSVRATAVFAFCP